MKLKELKLILKRLYYEYVKIHLRRIILCLILSIIVAGTSSSIAWLLGPAVKKIFMKRSNFSLLYQLLSFLRLDQGLSLYFVNLNIAIVGQRIVVNYKKSYKSILNQIFKH